MKWSILILTMPARAAMLARLLGILQPQIAQNGADGIELVIRPFDPTLATPPNRTLEKDAQGAWKPQATLPVGENREVMRRAARGEYISFIDDDDLVSPRYVERILPLLDGVDYIGFNLEQRLDGRTAGVHYRSLRYRPPCAIPPGGLFGHYADLSHLNPMRRELALRVPMSGWPADDVRWAEELRKLNIVRTEHYVDETLYYYLTRSRKPELKGSPAPLAAESCPWIFMTKIKVKMLTGIAGRANPLYDLPDHGYQPDEIVDLHPELAKFWFAAGIAEPVAKEPKVPKAKTEEPAPPAPAAPAPAAPAVEPPAAKVVPAIQPNMAKPEAETPPAEAPAETAAAGRRPAGRSSVDRAAAKSAQE